MIIIIIVFPFPIFWFFFLFCQLFEFLPDTQMKFFLKQNKKGRKQNFSQLLFWLCQAVLMARYNIYVLSLHM
jgi:hypothetical protein